MQNLEIVFPVADEYDSLKKYFKPRRNGKEFEWRDVKSGRHFVIRVDNNVGLVIATLSLRDLKDKSIFDLPSVLSNYGKNPKVLSLTVSAVDDWDQFVRDSPNDEPSYMTLNYNTEGNRQDPHGFYFDWGSKFEFKARGHYNFSALPSIIDFDKTVEVFRNQVQRGDFSTPTLLV